MKHCVGIAHKNAQQKATNISDVSHVDHRLVLNITPRLRKYCWISALHHKLFRHQSSLATLFWETNLAVLQKELLPSVFWFFNQKGWQILWEQPCSPLQKTLNFQDRKHGQQHFLPVAICENVFCAQSCQKQTWNSCCYLLWVWQLQNLGRGVVLQGIWDVTILFSKGCWPLERVRFFLRKGVTLGEAGFTRIFPQGTIGLRQNKSLHDNGNTVIMPGLLQCAQANPDNPVYLQFTTTSARWRISSDTGRFTMFKGLIPHKTKILKNELRPSRVQRISHSSYWKLEHEYIALELVSPENYQKLIVS